MKVNQPTPSPTLEYSTIFTNIKVTLNHKGLKGGIMYQIIIDTEDKMEIELVDDIGISFLDKPIPIEHEDRKKWRESFKDIVGDYWKMIEEGTKDQLTEHNIKKLIIDKYGEEVAKLFNLTFKDVK